MISIVLIVSMFPDDAQHFIRFFFCISWHVKVNSLYYDWILAHIIVFKAIGERCNSGKEDMAWLHMIKYCFKLSFKDFKSSVKKKKKNSAAFLSMEFPASFVT